MDVDVVVVTAIDPLAEFEPITLPSPAEIPPMFIPKPLVSIPINTFDGPVAVGTAETEILATVFPVITDAGMALVVVNNIPW